MADDKSQVEKTLLHKRESPCPKSILPLLIHAMHVRDTSRDVGQYSKDTGEGGGGCSLLHALQNHNSNIHISTR